MKLMNTLIATICVSGTAVAHDYTLEFEGSLTNQYKTFLTENFKAELISEIDTALERGAVVRIAFDESLFEDAKKEDDDREPICTVEIEETAKGEGKADGKVVGAEGKGEKTKKVKVSGPCDKVDKILKTINERN